ncbi:hypothetical protein R6Q59_016379 [Mikania micrantha]
MESWCIVKHKASLLIFMMLIIFMLGWAQGAYIEDERKALLEIKASLLEVSNFLNVENLLPTWVDHGKYCDWERIKCNTTPGFVTDLSLGDMFSMEKDMDDFYAFHRSHELIWRLNASLFLNFKELRRLDLSWNYIGNTFVSSGLERLSELKKLENLNLGYNFIETNIFPSLSDLTSLKILNLTHVNINGYQMNSPTHDISEFRIPENLEVLDLAGNGYYGTLQMQGSQETYKLSKLKSLNLAFSYFNENLITTLTTFTSLKTLDLRYNSLSGPFPYQEISELSNLEMLDMSFNRLNVTPSIQDCKSLMRLERLESVSLALNYFNKSIISCLSFLPSLSILDLSVPNLGSSLFPMQGIELKTLDMRMCGLRSLPLNGTMSNLLHLNLDKNNFLLVDDIMNSMAAFPSLRSLSLGYCNMGGKLFANVPNLPYLEVLILSENNLNGTLPMEDNNCFTGNIGINTSGDSMVVLDISENHFTGRIPSWMSNMCPYSDGCELVARNNHLDGPFPCGKTSFEFLDISQNSFSGPIPSCVNLKYTKHLHLGSNRFTGLVPDAFQNLTNVLTLDISQNYLSGRIPEFLGELSNLRILLLGKNNFFGSIPEKLCQLNNVSLIDISSNFLTGLIPRCLNNITGPKQLAFIQQNMGAYDVDSFWNDIVLQYHIRDISYTQADQFETRDEIQFTTKNNPLTYKGNILDYMLGLDLSSNKLTGEIPEELGMLTHILALNLSHNKLSGPIPVSFSNLSQIESLDLSSNSLSGKVPSELIQLTKLAVFDVSYNNLSGRLPERKAQFGTFVKESYEGNPLLCGAPLENNCMTTPQVSESSTKKDTENWYDIDKASFYGSSCSTWFVFMLGFVAILYINPYWRRRWLEFVAEYMYSCYYFLYDFVRYLYKLVHE